MLIYEVLKKDHDWLRSYMKKLSETPPGSANQRLDLIDQLRNELTTQARCEEKIFYGPLKGESDIEDLILNAYEEHSSIESLLRELELTDPTHERWNSKLKNLSKNLNHHLSEEESKVFAYAKRLLTASEAEAMGKAYFDLKEQIKEGSILQAAIEATLTDVADYMPSRFTRRLDSLI